MGRLESLEQLRAVYEAAAPRKDPRSGRWTLVHPEHGILEMPRWVDGREQFYQGLFLERRRDVVESRARVLADVEAKILELRSSPGPSDAEG